MIDLLQSIARHFPSDDFESQAGRDLGCFSHFLAVHVNSGPDDEVFRRVEHLSAALHPFRSWMLAYVSLDRSTSVEDVERVVKPIVRRSILPLIRSDFSLIPRRMDEEGVFCLFYEAKLKLLFGRDKGDTYFNRYFRQSYDDANNKRPKGYPEDFCEFIKVYGPVIPWEYDRSSHRWVSFCRAYAADSSYLIQLSELSVKIRAIWCDLPKEVPWDSAYRSEKSVKEWRGELGQLLDNACKIIREDKFHTLLLQSDLKRQESMNTLNSTLFRLSQMVIKYICFVVWEAFSDIESVKEVVKDKQKSISLALKLSLIYPGPCSSIGHPVMDRDVLAQIKSMLNGLSREKFPYAKLIIFCIDLKLREIGSSFFSQRIQQEIEFIDQLSHELSLSRVLILMIALEVGSANLKISWKGELRREGLIAFANRDFRCYAKAVSENSPGWMKFFWMRVLNQQEYDSWKQENLRNPLLVDELDAAKEVLDSSLLDSDLSVISCLTWAERKVEALDRMDRATECKTNP